MASEMRRIPAAKDGIVQRREKLCYHSDKDLSFFEKIPLRKVLLVTQRHEVKLMA